MPYYCEYNYNDYNIHDPFFWVFFIYYFIHAKSQRFPLYVIARSTSLHLFFVQSLFICFMNLVQTSCANLLCKPLCENPLCKPFVKTLCENPLCKPLCANPFVQTPHPHFSICYSFLNILLIYRYVTHFSISIKPGFFMFLFPGSLVPWFPGSLVPWFPGSLVPWFLGSLVPWFLGSLVPLVPLKGSYASKRKDHKETIGFLNIGFLN